MKRKIASLALLVLVASMIVGNIPNYAYADSQSDSLIRIATQARDQLRIQLSKMSDVSEDLKEQLKRGSVEVNSLEEAVKRDDISSAKQHFLSAMKIFTNLSQKISEQVPETAASSSQPTRFSHELDRLERYLDILKRIAEKNDVHIDYSNIDSFIDKARDDLGEGKSDAAYSKIEEIKKAIIELNRTLKEKTRQITTERAISFAEKYLEQLDRLIAQARDIGVSQATIERLEEARYNLGAASDVDQIIIEVKHIISVKKAFEETKLQRINSRINQLEAKLEHLSNVDEYISELKKAQTMLVELKDLVSYNKLIEAIRIIHSLNNLITEIENSISSQDSEFSTEPEESIRSLDESKLERIKIKIQRLENQMNQLAEQVEENPAAKRWLDNAFSLLENVKSQLDDSLDEALKIIMKIEQILKRIHNTIQ